MKLSLDHRNIDLIIPVYKNAALTKRCIDSVIANLGELSRLDARVILINDSPDDNPTTDLLRAYESADTRVKLIENVSNEGFVKSVNRGLEISIREGRDVILINSDTETFPNTLEELVRVANLDPQIAFVSPRSNNASLCSLPHVYGGSVPSPQQAYTNWNDIAHLLPAFHFTPTAIGFYLLIKQVILSNFGGLREDFGIGYEEENDLILRANKAGYRAALANHSFAFHAGSASFSLLDLDLRSHQSNNLEKLRSIHPEFIPMVQRYESSPHFRSERLVSELVGLKHRNIEVAFELTGLGCNHNGTNEFALAVIRTLYARHSSAFNITLICAADAFEFHGLHKLVGLRRENERYAGTYAIAIKLGQPFDLHQINLMEDLAPINFYAMLDTIAEDCGYLSVTQQLDLLWQHVASHANGILYISKVSERMFISRFPEAASVPSFARLLPTKLTSYPTPSPSKPGRYILILGNHFAHKASDSTAAILSAKFPRVQFIVLGAHTAEMNNLRSYRSGTLSSDKIDALFSEATAVVLPSHVEGFGFGLMHALSRNKVVFAREIEVTREILESYKSTSEVHLYSNDRELIELLGKMTPGTKSWVDDSISAGWEEWVDGLAQFCKDSTLKPNIFSTHRNRLRESNTLRRAIAWDKQTSMPVVSPVTVVAAPGPSTLTGQSATHAENALDGAENQTRSLPSLELILASEGSQFIDLVYQIFLRRSPDTQGETHYLSRLRSGVSKLQIIQEISESAEGIKIAAVIPGLKEAQIAARRSKFAALRRLLASLQRGRQQ